MIWKIVSTISMEGIEVTLCQIAAQYSQLLRQKKRIQKVYEFLLRKRTL